jgi:hypothetical protein
MNARYSIAALAVGLPALGLQAIAYRAASSLATGKPFLVASLDPLFVALIGSAVSTLMLMVALGLYARAKGQSIFLGLLAVLSCVGLLVVALLPDKTAGNGP